jgi:general nucleoside transport system ATP-binding protein
VAEATIERIGEWMSGLWPQAGSPAAGSGTAAPSTPKECAMLRLEARPQPSKLMSLLSPLLALVLTASSARCCSWRWARTRCAA